VSQIEIALNGRYLYVQTYNYIYTHYNEVVGIEDLSVVRIDLFHENAVVVYSDLKNPVDKDKIAFANDFYFIGDKIVMPISDFYSYKTVFNICNVDMQNIRVLFETEPGNIANGDNIYLYDEDIYYLETVYRETTVGTHAEYTRLCRINIETGIKEILLDGVADFCIDGDLLYYQMSAEPYAAFNYNKRFIEEDITGQNSANHLTGEIVPYMMTSENTFYRIKLDYSRKLDFSHTFAVYTPAPGYYFAGKLKVCNGYIYTNLQSEGDLAYIVGYIDHVRIDANTGGEPYVFYRTENRHLQRIEMGE